MVYLDTSFIAPLFLAEATSARVAAKLQTLPTGTVAVSLWTKTEFAGLLARKVRMGDATADFADEVLTRFERITRESCQVIVPSAIDFDRATRYLQNYQSGLRAGDALHLAIAYNQGAQPMLTLDKGLAKAAVLLGIPVDLGV